MLTLIVVPGSIASKIFFDLLCKIGALTLYRFRLRATQGTAVSWGRVRVFLHSDSRPSCLSVDVAAMGKFLLRGSRYRVHPRGTIRIRLQAPYHLGSWQVLDLTPYWS